MRAPALSFLVVALVALTAPALTSQSAELRVVSASPNGELNQIDDANEIRVIFSEPMVTLGRVPSNPSPAWIRIAPAIPGTFRWSGTTVLLFTPAADRPLPYSTRHTVTIDASATSAAGRRLGSPYEFSFITPTVKLTSVRWYRRDGRADRPVVLVLDFNQRMTAERVGANVAARYEPHDWDAPVLSTRERARMNALEPQGIRQFDAKVSAARAAAARTGPVALRLTNDWDRERYPPRDSRVVLETTTVPPAGTWLAVTAPTNLTGADGTAQPPQAQTSVAELAPVFFAMGFECRTACDPSGYNGLRFSSSVPVADFARALSIRDITQPTRETAVAQRTATERTGLDDSWAPSLEDAGYNRQPPARTYAYRLDPTFASTDGQSLGYPWIGIVENWHERAFTSFGDGHGVWERGGGPDLPFYSRNFTNVTQWFARILPADLMRRIVELEGEDFRQVPPGNGTLRPLAVRPDETQSYGLNLNTALTNGAGLVWAGLRPGESIPRSEPVLDPERSARSTIVQVTNLGISVKDSPQSTLVFVTRLDNGDAVPGASIAIINRASQQLWRGTTGADGVAMAPPLPLRDPDDWYQMSFIVTAEKDGDIGYLASNWNEGIMPWDFDQSYELWESTDILRGSVFTDRGVYRPGEEVHVKAVVRADTPNGIRLLPAGSTLDVRVTDTRNREVDRRTVTLNRWSSAEWTWTVPASGTLGNYFIRTLLPGTEEQPAEGSRRTQAPWLRQVSGTFLVAAYRRPDFRVDTRIDTDVPVAGAALSATLDARYLFGGTMSARPVRWSITRQPVVEVPAPIANRFPEDQFVFGYEPPRELMAERIAGADASLDTTGRFTTNADSARDIDFAYRYTFEGDVEDVSRQHVANRSTIVVHPAPWYIGLRRPPFFANTATGTTTHVVVADLGGQPVAGIPVTVSLTRVQWNSVRRAEGGGFYTWDTEEVRVPSGEWTVTSAATPVPVNVPVPEGGYYIVTASASDADGRRTKTETYFYGIGSGYTAWERFDHNRIDLEPEKKTWKPGDRARIMIKSPWETATALLTVEREGIRRYERFALTSTQQTVEVPVTLDDIPNVFVSVLLIRGRTSNDPGPDGSDPGKPTFRLGYTELFVEDAAKKLSVDVAADRAEYRPANAARVTLAVTDSAGRPASSEVTLWAVDYGVLSLTDYRLPDVTSAIYRQKALQVMNEDSRQRIVSRRVLTPKGGGEGGGGGAEAGADAMRRDFRPLAFWIGSVETDATGRAVRDVTLPESLTTYRIMAVAGDTASRFGTDSAEIKVNKPLNLLAAFPRFLSSGDRASFGAVLSSTLTTAGQATVTIRSLDPTLLQFEGGTSRTFQLAAAGTEPVRFDAIARGTGTARIQVTARLGDERDAFEMTLPVTAPKIVETTAAFGETTSRATERIAIPRSVLPNEGALTVQLASSALVGLGPSARYLMDYPYGCAEQKASAAMAFLFAADLGEAFSGGRVAPEQDRARAASLISELSKFQCSDGGFGYWPGSCSRGSVYLTAYVLHVLGVARSVGVAVDAETVTSALNFLEAEVQRDAPPAQVQWIPLWAAGQAFGVKILAEAGRNQDSNITRLLSVADRMPIFALSYLADAMAASGARTPAYAGVVTRMANATRIEGERAHVDELDDDALRWIWSSDVRTTALVLEGFVRRNDDATLIPGMVRWLLAERTGGRWDNTQDNVTALHGLVAYYKRFESEEPNMTATVSLGNDTIGTVNLAGRSSSAQPIRLAMPDLLREMSAGEERPLVFERRGTGRLFYSARLNYTLPAPPTLVDQGMRVERRYERFVENGTSAPSLTYAAGDLIRVTLAITVPQDRRYVAVTDALPAGAEAVDSWFRTTASDLARDASVETPSTEQRFWFERGGFDYVDKYDDRVMLFATRLSEGRHEFSYLIRATTAGTFRTAGTVAEEMYAPEVTGRSPSETLEIR